MCQYEPQPDGGAEVGATKEAFKGVEDGGEDGVAKEAFGGEEGFIVEKQEQQKEMKEHE